MLRIIAKSVTSRRGRFVAVLAWIVLPLSLFMISPSLTEVSSSRQEDFLPIGAESTKAIRIQERHFPNKSGIPGILVYKRLGGLTDQDLSDIKTDFTWLEAQQEEGVLGDLTSIFNNPGFTNILLSEDRSTLMIFFSVISDGEVSPELVQEQIGQLREKISPKHHDGLEVWVTGTAGILQDAASVFQSIDIRITTFTVLLVLVILLAIYRAPLLAILPLLSAGLAYLAANGLVALLADKTNLPVTAQATSIMVVLIFGAGTDYMLFISSRFKEYLSSGVDGIEGISKTMANIGPAIFSSAATTIVAMLVLVLATLRSFQVLGPILALGMCLAIASGLTFVPAVLSIFGRSAYWPGKINATSGVSDQKLPKSFWHTVGLLVAKRPLLTAIGCSAILLIMSTGTLSMKPSFNLLASLPDQSESVQGFKVIGDSFPSGSVSPTSVFVVLNDNGLDNLESVEFISAAIMDVPGVSHVTSPSRPFGTKLEIPPTRYRELIQNLPVGFKDQLRNSGMGGLQEIIRSSQLNQEQSQIAIAFASTSNLISDSGNVVRINVVFQEDPGSLASLEKISDLRATVSNISDSKIKEIVVGGTTAIQYDTKAANQRDIKVIAPIVLTVILTILIILVRAIIAPIYMLGSVVLSFLGSLGLSVFIFQNLLGHDGVGSWVPTYMFVFLIALGIDYNIYVISRVKEESHVHGIKQGALIAISRTGGVITSAGIILAGTFSALMTLPLRDLFQLGFVVALGVLIDTFLVRGVMIPSLVILHGKWNWWPCMTKRPEPNLANTNE